MSKRQSNKHKIEITSLIDDAIADAMVRREKNLTPEEAKQIKGGAELAILGGRLFIPIIVINT